MAFTGAPCFVLVDGVATGWVRERAVDDLVEVRVVPVVDFACCGDEFDGDEAAASR